MKKALLFLPLFVAGCMSPGQVCNSYGFTPGTSEFALCLPFIPSAAETLEFPPTAGYLRRHA